MLEDLLGDTSLDVTEIDVTLVLSSNSSDEVSNRDLILNFSHAGETFVDESLGLAEGELSDISRAVESIHEVSSFVLLSESHECDGSQVEELRASASRVQVAVVSARFKGSGGGGNGGSSGGRTFNSRSGGITFNVIWNLRAREARNSGVELRHSKLIVHAVVSGVLTPHEDGDRVEVEVLSDLLSDKVLILERFEFDEGQVEDHLDVTGEVRKVGDLLRLVGDKLSLVGAGTDEDFGFNCLVGLFNSLVSRVATVLHDLRLELKSDGENRTELRHHLVEALLSNIAAETLHLNVLLVEELQVGLRHED